MSIREVVPSVEGDGGVLVDDGNVGGGEGGEMGYVPDLGVSSSLLDAETAFSDDSLGLDPRLVRACADIGWARPTLVQSRALPLAVGGRDLLLRAQTGSGKTGAYVLAALQGLLGNESGGEGYGGDGGVESGSGGEGGGGKEVEAVILVPSRDLVGQVSDVVDQLTRYCRSSIGGVVRLDGSRGTGAESAALSLGGRVLVSTPGRLVWHLRSRHMKGRAPKSWEKDTKLDAWSRPGGTPLLSSVRFLVVDEADLCLAFGHGKDVQLIAAALPASVQSVLASATLSPGVDRLRRLVLRQPAVLRLDEAVTDGKLEQYSLECASGDKHVLVVALTKLGLLVGRTVIFCNQVDEAYKLRLVLAAFGVTAHVWNPKLPASARAIAVSRFHRGEFDFLICVDDNSAHAAAAARTADEEAAFSAKITVSEPSPKRKKKGEEDDASSDSSSSTSSSSSDEEEEEEEEEEGEEEDEEEEEESGSSEEDGDESDDSSSDDDDDEDEDEDEEVEIAGSSVRGLDLYGVKTVVNWDLPTSVDAYRHRVGRTGRGGRAGVALTLINPHDPTSLAFLERLRAELPHHPTSHAPQPIPLPFDTREVDGFRYRVRDAVRGATPSAIRAAQMAEVRAAIAASDKLRAHFEDFPRDLAVLQATAATAGVRQENVTHAVPDYLLRPGPDNDRGAAAAAVAKLGQKRTRKERSKEKKEKKDGVVVPRAREDPLKLGSAAALLLNPDALSDARAAEAAATLRSGGPPSQRPLSSRDRWRARNKKSIRAKPSTAGVYAKTARKKIRKKKSNRLF